MELGQDLFELGSVGMFAGKYDWHFDFGRPFEKFNSGVIDSFSLIDGFEFVLETHTNCIDVGLDPDECGRIAGGTKDLGKFAAIFFGVVPSFEDERGAGAGDLLDEK